MKKLSYKLFAFTLAPLTTFILCSFLAIFFNNSFSIDPDYVYLINGLNVFRGDFQAIIHVDHPGTPLQMLIGGLIAIIGTLRGAEDISLDVLNNPQLYIKSIIIIIAFFHSLVLFFIGKRFYKYNGNLLHGILLQLSILISASVLFAQIKLFTETLLPLGSLLLILLSIELVWGNMKGLKFAILSGIVTGIFIAVKITFIPLIFLPLILVEKWYNKLTFILTSVLFFTLSVLPIISKLTFFKEFILGIATHDGLYGNGPKEPIVVSKILTNIWNLLNIDYTFTIILTASFIAIIFFIFNLKKGVLKNKEFRLLFSIVLVLVLQLIMVSKHAGMRYMIPSLVLSILALTIIIKQSKLKYYSAYLLLAIVLIFGVINQIKSFTENISNYYLQSNTLNFISSTIKKEDAVLIVSSESWYGSPFVAHSLMFGKLYCASQGFQYAKNLKQVYPKFYFWTHHNQQYCNWENNMMPDQIINENQSFYLYLQTDNLNLYQNVREDFSNRLKFCSKDSVVWKLCFSDKKMGEEIYYITIYNKTEIRPKYKLFCDFEMSDSLNYNLVRTNLDSVYIEDGLKRTDYNKFQGKYSICITKDNPYGISVKMANIHQHDFISVSLMCQRTSKKDECCIALKAINPNDGFSTSGGTFVEEINGWEKIRYTYRFNYEPMDGKIEMFVWNISKNPMYFDNLQIEIY